MRWSLEQLDSILKGAPMSVVCDDAETAKRLRYRLYKQRRNKDYGNLEIRVRDKVVQVVRVAVPTLELIREDEDGDI